MQNMNLSDLEMAQLREQLGRLPEPRGGRRQLHPLPTVLTIAKGIRVFLDGPALLVRCAGEADRLYPVERLSRVVSHPAVSWEQEALLCLLGKDIPVIFIDDCVFHANVTADSKRT